MKITDLLKKQSICLDGKADSKEQVIREMVDLMAEGGNINDIDTYRETVFKREEEGTTGIGEGIAIPHGKTEAVSAPGLAAMVLPEGVDYDSLDGEPAYLIFLIAAPNTEDNVHLEVLSRLSMLLMDEDFRNKLLHAKDVDEFLAYVDAAEKEKFPEEAEEKAEAPADASAKPYQILAVTACPTGIAHTYMAAEGLEKKAKEMGVTIKVETNGSGGAKNVLTPEEIAACDCIIIAADKDVAMARFDGKPLISTKVSDGINKAQELIERALSGNAPVYHSKGGATEEGGASSDGDTIGRKIYKSLMNGVSHMLPFVIGGGILIALSFLVDGANAYSMTDPSNSRNARPCPEIFCMINPSPPNRPEPNFFWKKIDNSTLSCAARKPAFCTTISFPGAISQGLICPGKLDANAIIPGPPSAV